MKYTLKFNGTFDLEETRNFEAYLQNFLFRNNLGWVEREMTKVCYKEEEIGGENCKVKGLVERAEGLPVFEVNLGS